MIVAIQQPEHLPWIGFFNKMAQCDRFILLDHVQFKKNYFENRNRIKTANGPAWLTVPVKLKGKFGQSMMDVEVGELADWKKKYLKTVEQTYAKSPYFDAVHDIIFPVISARHIHLVDINIQLIKAIAGYLGIGTPMLRSSEMDYGDTQKADLILQLCKAAKAAIYISGPDGRTYLSLDNFEAAGIKVAFHDFVHTEYPQRFGPFLSHMSVIDLIAYCGPGSAGMVRECYKIDFGNTPHGRLMAP